MLDPAVLRSLLVAALKDTPVLIEQLGGAQENVVDYVEEENGDLLNTIFSLDPPKLLVTYQGTNATNGQRSMWQHNFSLVFRPGGSPTGVLAAIINGIRTAGTGLPLIFEMLHPSYEPMALPSMRRAVIPVSPTASKDYWEITTSFTSRGTE